MVKQFKGQTKVADVQEAFDDIVTKINNLVTSYNAQSFVEEIDYTVGGTTLAPSGYTLTVGGYKQFLKACEGVVTGCKPIKVDDNHFKVTTGMLVARNGIFRLPDSILDIPTSTDYRRVYYNPYTLAYQWTGSGTISYTETKTIQLGCNLYQNVKDDTKYYGLNSQANSDNIASGSYYATISGFGNYNPYGSTRGMFFRKYYDYSPISEDGKSMQLRINDYPVVIIEDNNLKTGDDFIITWEGAGQRSGGLPTISYTEEYYGGNYPNFCLGTLGTDGVTFTPKLYLSASTSYPNGNMARLHTYLPTTIALDSNNGLKASCNWDDYSSGGFGTDIYVNWAFGDGKSKFKFTYNNETEIGYIEVYQYVEGEEVLKFSIKLPEKIDNYDVNCIIPNIGVVPNGDDTIYDTYTQNEYIFNADCFKVTASGTEVGINTESRQVTITEVVTEESDTAAYRVCDINPNCTSKYIGTVHNAQCEDLEGTYEITNETKDYTGYWNSWADWNTTSAPWYEALDTSSGPKFVIGMPACTGGGSKHDVGSTEYAYLFGEEVYKMVGQRDRAGISYCPSTWLYVPKGVSNPYTYYSGYHNSNDPKWSKQKVLDVEIERDIDDASG